MVVSHAVADIGLCLKKRSAFVVGAVQGKIEFSSPHIQEVICIAHSV
ncbi:hypothetical protein HMPREF0880_02289 [Yokenella regensburgei ATCC 43003]|nr:hypothetical protein HMPREF0880_02289 [Yokenella regensburgei ATCC 43003]